MQLTLTHFKKLKSDQGSPLTVQQYECEVEMSHLLKSLQMQGKHWWGRRDQHLLRGVSVDIFGSCTKRT